MTQRREQDPSARRLVVLGVPTSAGSHNGGQEKAPQALRDAGLVTALRGRGRQVDDLGDLPTQRHRPAGRVDDVRDADRVVAVAQQAAERVAEVLADGGLPVVLGGDCTITLGVVAAFARSGEVGLLYFDGDADLSTPASSGSGVLDTMGMTHLLGDGHPAVAGLGPRRPLLQPDQVTLFGFDPAELDTGQWTRLTGFGLHAVPAPSVRADPAGAADAACRRLERRGEPFLVHVDVDVLDTGAFPLANFPHFAGLTLTEAATCLQRFCSSEHCAGLVLTEVNPDHDTEGALATALVDVIADAFDPSRGGSAGPARHGDLRP